MKQLVKLAIQANTLFLIITSCIFILLRLPSLFEPYWYGDEGIYEVIGYALRHGRMLYVGIWDNKPPLLYYIYALVNGNQQGARLLSLLFGVASIWTFYFLSKKLFKQYENSQKIVFITTGIFAALFATPLLEGTIANAENFMIFPILLASLLIWKSLEKQSFCLLLTAGLLLGISFLCKVVALFDFAAFFLFIFFVQYKNLKTVVKQIPTLFIFGISFFLPFIVTLLFFYTQGQIKIALQSMLFSNVGYVGYGNSFIIPQGLLIIKLLLLSLFSLTIFLKRRHTSPRVVFIFLWFSFALFSAYFSQRPYTHYVLVLLSSSCLFLGLCMLAKRFRLIISITGILIFAYVILTFQLYNNIPKSFFTYYTNFISYTFGKKTTNDYYTFFDQVVPRDYALANFINIHKKPTDQLFIWGNSGQIYKLTNTIPVGRYIVAYHITSTTVAFNETKAILEKIRPQYIIALPNQLEIPFSLRGYKSLFLIDNALIYAKNF